MLAACAACGAARSKYRHIAGRAVGRNARIAKYIGWNGRNLRRFKRCVGAQAARFCKACDRRHVLELKPSDVDRECVKRVVNTAFGIDRSRNERAHTPVQSFAFRNHALFLSRARRWAFAPGKHQPFTALCSLHPHRNRSRANTKTPAPIGRPRVRVLRQWDDCPTPECALQTGLLKGRRREIP